MCGVIFPYNVLVLLPLVTAQLLNLLSALCTIISLGFQRDGLAVTITCSSCRGPDPVPRAHIRWFTAAFNFSSKGSDALFYHPWEMHSCAQNTATHINTQLKNKLRIKSFKKRQKSVLSEFFKTSETPVRNLPNIQSRVLALCVHLHLLWVFVCMLIWLTAFLSYFLVLLGCLDILMCFSPRHPPMESSQSPPCHWCSVSVLCLDPHGWFVSTGCMTSEYSSQCFSASRHCSKQLR